MRGSLHSPGILALPLLALVRCVDIQALGAIFQCANKRLDHIQDRLRDPPSGTETMNLQPCHSLIKRLNNNNNNNIMHVTIAAFLWGFGSALTLPLGAAVSFLWTPSPSMRAALMSFGGGALLFALAIDLFGDGVFKQYPDISTTVRLMLGLGAIAGGVIFETANHFLNARGSFRRSLCAMRSHFRSLRHLFALKALRALARLHMMKDVSRSELARLLPFLIFDTFKAGDELFSRLDVHTYYYFILSGKVHLSSSVYGEVDVGENDLLGDLRHVQDELSTMYANGVEAHAVALTDVTVVKISRTDFDRIVKKSPGLARASASGLHGIRRPPKAKDVVVHVDNTEDILDVESQHGSEHDESLEQHLLRQPSGLSDSAMVEIERGPTNACESMLDTAKEIPMTEKGLEKASQLEHAPAMAAALAIWLGIAIDGVPESLTIGMEVATHPRIPFSLIFGVFASNFPEALANSIAMQMNGMSKTRVLWMWMSIAVMTGVGASIGAVMFHDVGTGALLAFVNFIRGVAAGSMLTMIARSLLPEASVFNPQIVGLSTLAGFVTSYFITLAAQS